MAGQNPGSPTDFQYFYEDEVYKINNSGQVVFGLVLENYEANLSDQESDTETPIQKGEIRVVWHPSGTERVISEKSVSMRQLPGVDFIPAQERFYHCYMMSKSYYVRYFIIGSSTLISLRGQMNCMEF